MDTQSLPELLRYRESEILDDCIAAISKVDHGPLIDPAKLLTEAALAARAGHCSAAQALAANTLDTMLRISFPLGQWQGYRRMRESIGEFQKNPSLFHLRTGLALAPVLLATNPYDSKSDAIPGFYNRHATAHAVSRIQYTRTNAIIATMTAASALREFYQPNRYLPRVL